MKKKIFQVILIHLITLVYIKLKHEDIKNKYTILFILMKIQKKLILELLILKKYVTEINNILSSWDYCLLKDSLFDKEFYDDVKK